uniref:TTF-type domain-containing protein n=1 Tax=Dicentrarchus labrax TaxID=13489 RepID=A0A8P4KG01_DICLA
TCNDSTREDFSQKCISNANSVTESVPREWLCYSPSAGSVFCFACKIFGENKEKSAFVSGGYFDWKHANDRIAEHESCDIHRKAMIAYINQAADSGTVDSELKKQFNEECEYWTQVLQRVVTVVKFLAEQGLAFRFDPFLKAHIEKYGNAGRGTPSYLSLNVCEEFIQLMGQKVVEEVISRVKLAKYFAISVDSTPDITHVDQLTFILRYISPEGCIEERFVKFLPIESHMGEALFNSIIGVLEEMGIDINNCRGQCYDNANNMSGAYKGVQARIKQISSLAQWVPCAAHTLNLVGVNSVNYYEETEQFFSFVQALFNFSSKTTSRWQMIRAGLQPNDNKRIETLKSLSDTRWSAHAVTTKALCQNYAGIQQSLLNIADDEHQNLSTREEARALHKKMIKLEIALMSKMWNAILQRFQGVSIALQAVELDLCNAVDLVRSLREYVAGLRDQFDSFETAARNMSPIVSHEYKADTKRKKKRKRQADESSEPECELSGHKRFCTSVYICIIDRLVSELDRRYQSYKDVCENFGFLNGLHFISPQDLRSAALSLQRKYNSDLEEDFVEEVVQFREFVQDENVSSTSAVELLKFLRRRKLHTVFPNTDIALRLFLTMPVTNASGERSFSKLGLVKNRLRSSMQQDRVSHLTLMSIEHDILRDLDFKDIIRAFSLKKTRRKHF